MQTSPNRETLLIEHWKFSKGFPIHKILQRDTWNFNDDSYTTVNFTNNASFTIKEKFFSQKNGKFQHETLIQPNKKLIILLKCSLALFMKIFR